MSRKIALKKLTLSDLTIFEYHLRQGKAGKQKSINLNRDIFEKLFYPNLTAVAEENDWEPFILNLTIFGPGNSPSQVLPQKIIKGGTYKNWRLNGKLIPTPDGDERYHLLDAGDYAIMEFIGAAWPTQMKMTLVAANHQEDAGLHRALNRLYPTVSMRAMEFAELEEVEKQAGYELPTNHPFHDFLDTPFLENAANGDINALNILYQRRKGRGVSHEEFRKAKKAAEGIGRLGEYLLDQYLADQVGKSISGYKWEANENAIASYDFEIMANGYSLFVDAKSTAGPHTNPIHISLGELREMAWSKAEYRIYRLYEVMEGYAKVMISAPMATLANSIINVGDRPLREFGATIDSVSISPDKIEWTHGFVIDYQDFDYTE
ncbi:DUF3883 domain-containing protein [Vreelandella neptunia]|uniref:protein NO VEIN domain-containing protein n=1 Tax=Vreelandella neptunia TaxID=115551 RepID=UPI00315B3EC5